ncbi:hypothetical protein [Halobacterium bonnevillei]|uniref:Lipoprotein n=1 Tax=Halobacterium bonnevillei TaxID=2692200 RepID=A0A6B0SIS3_9EURY|nr:hypothetical protein [Halobacterium bonnevillei]MXR21618.1 hypothetical protein [Halobacterium bonnevillei]
MKRRAVIASASAVLVAGCTGPAADDGQSGGDTPSYEDTSFEVTDAGCGGPAEAAAVSFDESHESVAVSGTTSGPNGCYLARVADATYDASGDEFRLVVEAYDDADPDEGCTQCITEIDYEATASFDGGLPGRVVVVHRSRGEERDVTNASP